MAQTYRWIRTAEEIYNLSSFAKICIEVGPLVPPRIELVGYSSTGQRVVLAEFSDSVTADAALAALAGSLKAVKIGDSGKVTKLRQVRDKILFDYETGQYTGITEPMKVTWAQAFPAVEIDREIQQAAAWAYANPANHKSNWNRFLVNWLRRAQDRALRKPDDKSGPAAKKGVHPRIKDRSKCHALRDGLHQCQMPKIADHPKNLCPWHAYTIGYYKGAPIDTSLFATWWEDAGKSLYPHLDKSIAWSRVMALESGDKP